MRQTRANVKKSLFIFTLAVLFVGIMGIKQCWGALANKLFATDLPGNQWVEFAADGYSVPVSGVIFRPDKPSCCGVPLGGVATGCLDIEVGGVLGFEAIFNQYPRRPQLQLPFLGVAVGDKMYVLAAKKFIDGGTKHGCVEPDPSSRKMKSGDATIIKIEGVESAKNIHYFGHYPIVDIEYEIDAPIEVGLRAWSPFVPGNIGASNIPAVVFEVRLRNPSETKQKGTLAFSFPGIPPIAILNEGEQTYRRETIDKPLNGVAVSTENNIGYCLGVIGGQQVRSGGQLSSNGKSWSQIAGQLPIPSKKDSGVSIAVDFELSAKENKTIRFVLSWYSPIFVGDRQPYRYTQFYATRYRDAVEVAGRMVNEHQSLLKRILAWQEVIYSDKKLPVWLRDTLINNLCLITETSYWAAAKDPLGDWCYPDGYFAMNESPRGCSHIECIPCTWYGNMPINYFFPKLARTTLRAYTYHQRADGAAPFDLGPCCSEIGLMTPSYDHQKALNSFCFVDLVDRLWMCTGDKSVLDEFYPAVKRATTYTVKMSSGPDAVISFPKDQRKEWWEGFDWHGMAAHAGGLRISNMYIAERMAKAIGDEAFARQCREWIREGQRSMETKMWNEKAKSYLLYHDPEAEKIDDTIMSNQLDGQWTNDFHGLPSVFRKDRVDQVLETVKQSCLSHYGAVSFAKPDKTPLVTYGIFPPEIMMLGFTYIYEGDRQTGLDILHNCMRNLVLKHRHGWDLPNTVSGALTFSKKGEGYHVDSEGVGEGQRTYGTDYYQNMMLWSAPAVLAGTDLAGPCKPGGLVDRVISAGRMK